MSENIVLHEPFINGNEWQYVKECLDTGWVSSSGKFVDLFEQKIAEYTGARYAIAMMNGTAALQVSLRLAGVIPGDEVIVPTIAFVAPVNAVCYNGAEPIFMDADDSYNIDIEKTIEFILCQTEFNNGYSFNKLTGKRVAALIVVHVFGNAVKLDQIITLCKERNIAVIEDAAQGLGTRYTSGEFAGNYAGTIGKLGCLSFNGNKIVTTGGGGMVLTNDSMLAEKAKYLTTQAKDDPVRYVHNEVGYNFRLTNVQAAIGVAQLENLQGMLERKKHIYKQYLEGLRNIEGFLLVPAPDYAENNHWLNVLRIDSKKNGRDRDSFMDDLKKVGIQTRPVWYPNHLQKPYMKCQNYRVEKASKLVEEALCLPSGSRVTEKEVSRVINSLCG